MAVQEEIEETSVMSGKYLWYKVLKQSCLLGIWLSMGLLLECIGPTIPDLKNKLELDYEEISRALVGTSVGYFVGSGVGGVLHERFYKHTDLLMSAAVFLGAVAMFLMPWTRSLSALAVVFCCTGVSVALSNAGGNAMVLHLWGEASGPPMYMLHFCFGVGGLIAPQIARPFLTPTSQVEANSTEMDATQNLTDINHTSQSHPYIPSDETGNTLFYPYTIIGGINVLFSLQMLALYICGYPKGFPQRTGSRNLRALVSPRSCMSGRRGIHGAVVLVLLFMYYFHAVGGENVYGKWIFSFSLETDVSFTKDRAALLTSIFWLSHITGRAAGIVLSKWVPIRIILFVDIIGLLIASTVLALAGHSHSLVLMIFTACMGLLVSPLFPGGLLWANTYLKMNSMTVMVCILGGSSGHLFYVYLSGYLFEYIGPRSMMFIEIFYSIIMMANFVLLEIFGRLSVRDKTNMVTVKRESDKADESEVIMMK